MVDPQSMSPGSTMPPYPWLATNKVDTASTGAKIRTLQRLGVPYPEGYDQVANTDMLEQAKKITMGLGESGMELMEAGELVAQIAACKIRGTHFTESRPK